MKQAIIHKICAEANQFEHFGSRINKLRMLAQGQVASWDVPGKGQTFPPEFQINALVPAGSTAEEMLALLAQASTKAVDDSLANLRAVSQCAGYNDLWVTVRPWSFCQKPDTGDWVFVSSISVLLPGVNVEAEQPRPASAIMKFFAYSHLPQPLQAVSKPIGDLASEMDKLLPDGPEKSAGLRKLLEAKDCFVRAKLA
jgi:hypothetical protein